MRKLLHASPLLAALIMAGICGSAQDRPTAFKGALIYPVTGAPIEKGVLIVQNGRITAVGDASTPIPSNAQIIDATNKVIIPGIVDTHSHIGGP
jgi:imidazolonepropionase-like amidohydrolase